MKSSLLIWNYLTNAVTAWEDNNVPLTNFLARNHVGSRFDMKFGIKQLKLDGSLPANSVNDRRGANAVTLKSTFCLP